MQENFADILEQITIQHTPSVLAHTVTYVYIKIDKRVRHMKCSFMETHIKQNVHS